MTTRVWQYPGLWKGCVGAWCPSRQRWPSIALQDYSPNNNHGTLTNMDLSTCWTPSDGKIGLSLNGSNNYVLLSDYASLNRMTVCFWWNLTAAGKAQTVTHAITKRGAENEFQLNVDLAKPYFGIWQSDTTNKQTSAAAESALNDNQWYHCAGIADGANLQLYVDGVQYGTTVAYDGTIADTTATLVFGQVSGLSANRYFNGLMDDVRIYDRALPLKEVRQLRLRRAIAYETVQRRRYKAAAAASRNNLMLLGVS